MTSLRLKTPAFLLVLLMLLALVASAANAQKPGFEGDGRVRPDGSDRGVGGAFGPSHVSGIRATITDVTDLDVTIDVTEFYVTNAAWTFSTAWIGVASTFGGVPLQRAVQFGDGTATPFGTSGAIPFAGYGAVTGLPVASYGATFNGENVHVYRGTFTHTYPSAADYTLTVRSVNGVGTTAGQAPPIATGNLVGSATPTFGNTYYFLTNTAAVALGSSILEVPTVSGFGLLVLASALAGIALLLLRKP